MFLYQTLSQIWIHPGCHAFTKKKLQKIQQEIASLGIADKTMQHKMHARKMRAYK